jgi:hypothetical protein
MLQALETEKSLSERNYDDIMQSVANDSIGKADYTTSLNNLHMDYNGNIEFIDTNKVTGTGTKDIGFNATDWAESQVYSKLGMPAHYFKRIKPENPDLVAEHFNYWTRKSDDNVMLRTRVRDNEAGIIRGIVSEKYSILDNDTTAETLRKILTGQEHRFKIQGFHLDAKRMHLRVTFNELTKHATNLNNGDPDNLQIGFDIVNSEVGAASLNILSLVFRLVCSNGLRAWRVEDQFSQRHIHLKEYEIYGRMVEAFAVNLSGGAVLLDNFTKTIETKIPNPFDAISGIAQKYNLTNEFADNAKNLYEGNSTAYGVINTITAASRELPNERRLDTERIAGRLIELSPKEWEVLSEVGAN